MDDDANTPSAPLHEVEDSGLENGGLENKGLQRRSVRLTLLFVALLLSLLAYLVAPTPNRYRGDFFHSNLSLQDVPEVVAPTGELKKVFEMARPATLRIELSYPLDIDFRNAPADPSMVAGVGTGFFISPDGLVLTAYHVVEQQGQLTAVGADQTRYPLTLVGFDAYKDLAVLQAEVSGEVPYLPIASEPPRVGGEIVAIGNSRGDFLQGRSGVVTALGVDAPYAQFASDTIKLTAALFPGDSGGPVINSRGEAVGVVSYISLYPSGSSDSFIPPYLRGIPLPGNYASYAVPVVSGGETLNALKSGLRHDVPVIGFAVRGEYNPRFGDGGLGAFPGVVVGQVEPGSPADRAGLRDFRQEPVLDDRGEVVGAEILADVIVAVDGERTRGYYELLDVLYQKEIGQTVTLLVQRGQDLVELELELGAKRRVFND